LVEENDVVAIKADKTNSRPDIDQLLVELGNDGAVIPFLAIYPGDGSDPITIDGPLTQQMVLDALKEAGPSVTNKRGESDTSETALAVPSVIR
jgi:thiol:disulfide interchange protein